MIPDIKAQKDQFLADFATPDTQARMKTALDDLVDEVIRVCRYHASWPVATAETWRYDRILWAFGIMLGEIPEDTPAPPHDEPYDREPYTSTVRER